jgi:AcrR family transcriptional regulator
VTPGDPTKSSTRDRIIEAAADLIPELGWDGVTSRRVAERAGVKTGVLHYHVASMDELLRLAAVRRIRQFFAGRIEGILNREDPGDAIEELFRSLTPADSQNPDFRLLAESLVAANRDEQLRRERVDSLAELRRTLIEWFRERNVASPESLAVTVVAAIDGFLLQRMLDPTLDPAPLVEALRTLASNLSP